MKKFFTILFAILLMTSLVSCSENNEEVIIPDTETNSSSSLTTPPTNTVEEKYSEGLEFTLSSDGKSYIVTGIGTCTDVDLIIPGTYNNLPVLSIGENAFKANTSIQSLSTGDSVMSIGAYAFQNCTSLNAIYFGDSFVSIEEYAFENCYSLANLYGGKNFKDFPLTAFQFCSGLTNIEIDKDNPYYTTIDGSFYSKDGSILLRYAVGKKDAEFIVPSQVTAIGEQAFYGAVNLKTITLPSALTSIGSMAFGYCISLEEIMIPVGVKSIGYGAFAGSNSLTRIFYDGTIEQWKAISKMYWAISLNEYTVFCTDASVNHLGVIVSYPTTTP